MRLNFKKITAVLASTVMLGSSLGIAAAANYPSPFVVSGNANVAIVYGSDSPGGVDLIPAANIQTSLQSYMGGSSSATGSSTSGGDSVLIAKTSDNLNLGNLWSDLDSTVDEDDLTTLLADGTYIADDNDEFDYEQKIVIGSPNLTHFRDSDYESSAGLTERTPVVGFKISSSTFIMNYTMDFTSDAESDIVSDDGDDIEGSDLPLFGKTYYVSNLDNRTNSDDFWGTLTLLDSANKATVEEGETVDLTLNDKTYSVALNFIGSSTVKFDVDGEITSTLSAGETYKLADGSYIGVREINTQDYQGGIKTVEFSIGSGKLEIVSGSDIKLNDDTISGVKGFVYEGTGSSGTEKIDKIVIDWTTDEEVFLTAGLELVMPGFEAVKFTMGEFVRPAEEKITVEKDGDTSIRLTDVPIKDGDVDVNLLYTNSSGEFKGIGKNYDERLASTKWNNFTFWEKMDGADYDEYFVATYNTSTEAESYLLRAKVTYDSGDNRNETTIEKQVDGVWTEACDGRINTETCDIGSVTLTISGIQYTSGKNESVNITGGTDVNFNSIYTEGGLRIYLPYLHDQALQTGGLGPGAVNVSNASRNYFGNASFAGGGVWNSSAALHGYNTWGLYMDGEDKDDNLGDGTQFYLTIDDNSDGYVYVSQVQGGGTGGTLGLEVGDSTGVYEAYVYDDVGPRVLHYTKPDEDYAEVYYPSGDSESYGEVYIAEAGVTVTSGTTSSGSTQLGEVIVKDNEISSVQTKNLVIVGGSCVNSAAANLLGGAYCGAAFTEQTGVGSGQYVIQSFGDAYTTGKIALLVAGFDYADTVNAQKYLTTKAVITDKDTKYLGTSATEATLQA